MEGFIIINLDSRITYFITLINTADTSNKLFLF